MVKPKQIVGPLHADYNQWNAIGLRATEDSIVVLAQLFQRRLEANPLKRMIGVFAKSRVEISGKKKFGENRYQGNPFDGKRHGNGVLVCCVSGRTIYEGQ
jgi:hypothetical protein